VAAGGRCRRARRRGSGGRVMTATTLITGADGYVGRLLAARLLASGDELVLTVRAADAAELDAKRAFLRGVLPAADGRVTVMPVDLRDGEGLAAVNPRPVTRIVHSASVTRFNIDRDTARQVNVDGTARICEFARSCGRLERLLLLSTVYSTGRRTGRLDEAMYDDAAGFVNHYEWSKWEAERLALTGYRDVLPLSVLRLATVVADDEGGAVTQYNAFHHTLKLFFYGLLSVIPGDETTPIHVTSGEYSAAAAERVLDPDVPSGIYHALAPHPPTLRELIDTAFAAFETDPTFRRRSMLRPLFCDIESFLDLVHVARASRSSLVLGALETVVPFADQLYLHKDVTSDRLLAEWPGHRVPDARALVTGTCEYLVATHWGRKGEW